MARPLRGDEVLACVHRVALSRGAPTDVTPAPSTPESERRRRDAREHRRATLDELASLHPNAPTPASVDETFDLIAAGEEIILRPRLALDREGGRVAVAQALVRVGRVDAGYRYAPVVVKNCEVVELAPTRRTLRGTLGDLAPTDADWAEGVGVRATLTVQRAGILLAHATRVLASMGAADPIARAALVDRHRDVWWLPLGGADYPRFNLAAYDAQFEQRRAVLVGHERWRLGEAPYPTEAYWHRECPDCPYAGACEVELEARDDVSLTRFTNLDQQFALREHGVTTRARLARLDPARARAARSRVQPALDGAPEEHLGRVIDKLDDLIYRARVHVRGALARTREPEAMGCPTADVEVDVDMESYNDVTYLWGASVRLRRPVPGVEEGYHAVAAWDDLSPEGEARLFAQFWEWFCDVAARADDSGASFVAYCFWAQAEDTAMNRAVREPVAGGPSRADVDAFRAVRPARWVDLHECAKRQIQTEGPLGLKLLAQAAGFSWRDANPSGEASMLWFEDARGSDDVALAARRRLLEYNEDDCRATRALRDWLNGPARALAHRDDPVDGPQ